jgi:hypothetical protein
MHGLRAALVAVCLIGFVGCSATLVHITPAVAQAAAAPSDDSSSWTSKQWKSMKAKWAKEKEKWADCRKQAKEKGLKGRKSWSFLKDCMTK